MGQAKPSHDQPSMDEILSSIRRIIERSDAEAGRGDAPDSAPRPEAGVANGSDEPAEQADDRQPMSRSELNQFAEALDARVPASDRETVYDVNGVLTAPVATARARLGKYEGRLSEDDSRAFAEVASVLSATAGDLRPAAAPLPEAPQSTERTTADDRAEAKADGAEASAARTGPNEPPAGVDPAPADGAGAQRSALPEPLVSHDVSRSVGLSFEALSDTLRQQAGRDLAEVTEEMLRPMLADWLDNNLPSMVERLVRAEIERIARGEPRRD